MYNKFFPKIVPLMRLKVRNLTQLNRPQMTTQYSAWALQAR